MLIDRNWCPRVTLETATPAFLCVGPGSWKRIVVNDLAVWAWRTKHTNLCGRRGSLPSSSRKSANCNSGPSIKTPTDFKPRFATTWVFGGSCGAWGKDEGAVVYQKEGHQMAYHCHVIIAFLVVGISSDVTIRICWSSSQSSSLRCPLSLVLSAISRSLRWLSLLQS